VKGDRRAVQIPTVPTKIITYVNIGTYARTSSKSKPGRDQLMIFKINYSKVMSVVQDDVRVGSCFAAADL
jgi:hypothetical protein